MCGLVAVPGLFASDSEGFQRWLDIERARVKVEVSRAALSLITSLERAGNLPKHWAWRSEQLKYSLMTRMPCAG